MKICDERYTFYKVLGYFPFVTKESQILISPNFPRNTRIQRLLETFDTWIKWSDTGVSFWVVSSKLQRKCSYSLISAFTGVTFYCAVTHRSITCIIIFFQWLKFILKIRCNYHHLTTHPCFRGSQLRAQHWTVCGKRELWAIRGCNSTNGMCCKNQSQNIWD